eukprot:c18119_g1_i2.p1 GENE.c18119_g1_i2~~c18119_g1_i2.p1  ORF type:complete len:384 (+),score=59.18 c18119_g1_i2:773-1924(+)
MNLTFHVTCRGTVLGQSVYIVGSVPSLGKWDLKKSVRLQTDKAHFPNWRVELTLNESDFQLGIEYKYVIMNASDHGSDPGTAQWETFEGNRVLHPPDPAHVRGQHCCVLDGSYNHNQSTHLRVLFLSPGEKIRITCVRHGERWAFALPDQWQAYHTSHGEVYPFDDPLTSRGFEMGVLAGQRLISAGVQRIYSSPWTRCVQTAAAIAHTLFGDATRPLRLESGLMEYLHRDWYGQRAPTTVPADKQRTLRHHSPQAADPRTPCFLHHNVDIDLHHQSVVPMYWPEEHTGHLQLRVQRAIFELIQRHQVEDTGPIHLVLVTHGFLIEHGLLPALVPDLMQPEKGCMYASLTTLEVTGGGWGWELIHDRDDGHVRHLLDGNLRYV